MNVFALIFAALYLLSHAVAHTRLVKESSIVRSSFRPSLSATVNENGNEEKINRNDKPVINKNDSKKIQKKKEKTKEKNSKASNYNSSLKDASSRSTFLGLNDILNPEAEARDEKRDQEIYQAVVKSLAEWMMMKIEKRLKGLNRVKRDDKTPCYPRLGCFKNESPISYVDILPSTPAEIGTRFLLYTREDEEKAHYLDYDDVTTIHNSSFKATRFTNVIIPGFGSSCSREWVGEMSRAILRMEDVNLICVDWEAGAALPNYVKAASNTRVVGRQVSVLIEMLNDAHNASLDNYHLIGFSLGAHVAGYAGTGLKNLYRISGLDPAWPLFEGYPPSVRLDPTDAKFVDVIHTNADSILVGGLGAYQPMGHIDFYPNGGKMQKGCNNLFLGGFRDILWPTEGDGRYLCNHRRGYKYFTASVFPECKFPSFSCKDHDSFLKGDCFPCENCGVMGYYADQSNGRGQQFLVTSEKPPFCANQYKVTVEHTAKLQGSPVTTYGKVEITFIGELGFNETLDLTHYDYQKMVSGGRTIGILVPHPGIGSIKAIQIKYIAHNGWFYSGFSRWAIDKVSLMDSFKNIQSFCFSGTTLVSEAAMLLPLRKGDCVPIYAPVIPENWLPVDIAGDETHVEEEDSAEEDEGLEQGENNENGHGIKLAIAKRPTNSSQPSMLKPHSSFPNIPNANLSTLAQIISSSGQVMKVEELPVKMLQGNKTSTAVQGLSDPSNFYVPLMHMPSSNLTPEETWEIWRDAPAPNLDIRNPANTSDAKSSFHKNGQNQDTQFALAITGNRKVFYADETGFYGAHASGLNPENLSSTWKSGKPEVQVSSNLHRVPSQINSDINNDYKFSWPNNFAIDNTPDSYKSGFPFRTIKVETVSPLSASSSQSSDYKFTTSASTKAKTINETASEYATHSSGTTETTATHKPGLSTSSFEDLPTYGPAVTMRPNWNKHNTYKEPSSLEALSNIRSQYALTPPPLPSLSIPSGVEFNRGSGFDMPFNLKGSSNLQFYSQQSHVNYNTLSGEIPYKERARYLFGNQDDSSSHFSSTSKIIASPSSNRSPRLISGKGSSHVNFISNVPPMVIGNRRPDIPYPFVISHLRPNIPSDTLQPPAYHPKYDTQHAESTIIVSEINKKRHNQQTLSRNPTLSSSHFFNPRQQQFESLPDFTNTKTLGNTNPSESNLGFARPKQESFKVFNNPFPSRVLSGTLVYTPDDTPRRLYAQHEPISKPRSNVAEKHSQDFHQDGPDMRQVHNIARQHLGSVKHITWADIENSSATFSSNNSYTQTIKTRPVVRNISLYEEISPTYIQILPPSFQAMPQLETYSILRNSEPSKHYTAAETENDESLNTENLGRENRGRSLNIESASGPNLSYIRTRNNEEDHEVRYIPLRYAAS